MSITIPNTFSPNTTVRSAEVNENFTEVAEKALDKTGDTMTGTLTTKAVAPVADATHDLGSGSYRFKDLYLSGSVVGPAASNAFGTVAVSGQSNVVADQSNDTLTLVAGNGVTLTTSAGGDSVTIAASGGVSGPGSSTNTAFARWNGVGGTALINSTVTADTNGLITSPAGTGSGTVRHGGMLTQSVTPVGNVGAGEDNLIQLTIPASTLVSTGDRLIAEFEGIWAANANSKTLKVYLGTTRLMNCTGGNGTGWRVNVTIARTGAATQATSAQLISPGVNSYAEWNAGTETLANALTLKVTGEGVADNDIVCKSAWAMLLPA